MPELLTMQDLANGHLDVKALGEAANGDENTIVTTRTGNTYPSAERAINIMFQNGGLPATPFATKALMTASALVDGDYAQVTDDTVNDGLYVKTAGAWVKSEYDPLTQAKADATTKADAAIAESKTYTDTKAAETLSASSTAANIAIRVNEAQRYSASNDLELATDTTDLIYRRVDANGDMHVSNLDGSVQENIKRHDKLSEIPNGVPDITQVWDANDNLVSRTDNRGALYIAGGKGSVQHFMREPLSDAGAKYGFEEPLKISRQTYSVATKAAVANLQQNCQPYIEPPLLLVPNNLNLPDSILTAITVSDDNPVALLPFPYNKGGSVHPYALTLRKPLYGYRHLLADSNHKNGTEPQETPVLFGTNDWVNFDLIPDVKQPMQISEIGTGVKAYNSFLSDPWLSYDLEDGALIYATRETLKETTGKTIHHITKSYDGVRWTPRLIVEDPVLTSLGVAPSTLYDPVLKVWHLWSGGPEGVVNHYTAPTYMGAWTLKSTTNFTSLHGIKAWHIEVKYVGNKFAICVSSRQEDSQVQIGFSEDGDNWVMSGDLISPRTKSVYKPSFEIEFKDEDTVRFIFFWSHWDWINIENHDPEMPLHVQYSNWITISSLT